VFDPPTVPLKVFIEQVVRLGADVVGAAVTTNDAEKSIAKSVLAKIFFMVNSRLLKRMWGSVTLRPNALCID
jgi:hypothetical protein